MTGDYAVMRDGTFQMLDARAFVFGDWTSDEWVRRINERWRSERRVGVLDLVVDVIDMPDLRQTADELRNVEFWDNA